jgi:phosphoglycerate dehydrogenase-like enzyme
MRVVAIARRPALEPELSWVGGSQDLPVLLEQADFVSLHVPSTTETRHLIGRQQLDHMKPTAFLLNLGRGELVERTALLDALRERRIAGAGLDVYWEEPPDPADPVFALDNVVTTPHLGGVTHEALARIADRVTAILEEHLLREPARG